MTTTRGINEELGARGFKPSFAVKMNTVLG